MTRPTYATIADLPEKHRAQARAKYQSQSPIPATGHQRAAQRGSGKAAAGSLHANEDDVQAAIVDFLRLHGFIVKTTVRRRRRCWNCGEWPRLGDGVDRSVGDLLVRHPSMKPGFAINADVKRPAEKGRRGGALSPAQRAAVENGDLLIWRGPEEALADCRRGVDGE